MPPVPSRQIHLDFHTSEHIPGVGSRFDKRQFQEALQIGHVNLINIFGKGHHGWAYYPTQAGNVHPALHVDPQGARIDLLGAQIEACHEIGVRCPVYFTVGWSVNDAETHPEWCVRNADGTIAARDWDFSAGPDDPRPFTSWKFLCPSGGYLDLILAQTREICEGYEVDGFWYDICNTWPPCTCDTCRRGMSEQGVDVEDEEAVFLYSVRKWKHMMGACNRLLHSYHPDASVYYNGTTKLNTPNRNVAFKMYEHNTQHDLEDLPTTWGGYDKLPVRAKLFANTSAPMVAMSGKFHTSWGEFGGYKHPDALRYEAASMIAFGVACNFGDQLHPLGEMELDTYRNIGQAFRYVEQIEGYGIGGRPASNLGLWRTGSEADDEGTARMLLETQTDFAVVDPEADLSSYAAIVLTGAAGLTEDQAGKLNRYVEEGGRLLVLGESALGANGTAFLLDVGATCLGPGQYDVDYTVLGEELGQGLVSSPFLNYEAALRVQPDEGTEVLATIHEPYFSRTYARYCSHRNTPYRPEPAAHPAAIRAGNVVLLAHRLGKLYFDLGARLHRDLFSRALGLLHAAPTVRTELPSAGRVSFLHQPEHKRYVVHLLYAPPQERGQCLVIEDLPPLYDVPLQVRVPEDVVKAYLVPGEEDLAMAREGDAVGVTVPKVQCHQAVVFEY
jgi:hypothetical protein